MLDWFMNNYDWLFSGIGVVAVVAVSNKIQNLAQKKSQESSSVKSHFHLAESQRSPLSEPVAIERISPIAPKEIKTSIESAPPLQQKTVAQRYIGQRIEWDTKLFRAEQQGELIHLSLRVLEKSSAGCIDSFLVCCYVKFDEYPEFAVLPRDTEIRISGTIAHVSSLWIDIENTKLIFLPLKNAA